ncbi:PqqD family protein [Catenovulum agarivorans]|uniref:PqqD family protein n=1 Tax=Catenovulum agarivorans TaxID=1172192 RepID=UPI0002E3A41C|nr:PqqD family protein [Catenovulum agarivorans]
MDKSKAFTLSTSALFQSVDDEMVILDSVSGQYYTLNDVGTFIIDAVNAGLPFGEIIQLAIRTYDVSEQEFTVDCTEIIEEMLHHGLVVPA